MLGDKGVITERHCLVTEGQQSDVFKAYRLDEDGRLGFTVDSFTEANQDGMVFK